MPARSFSGEMHTLLVSRQVAGPSPVPPTFADLYRLPWREKGKSPKSALSALSQRDREFESISLRAGKWFSPLPQARAIPPIRAENPRRPGLAGFVRKTRPKSLLASEAVPSMRDDDAIDSTTDLAG